MIISDGIKNTLNMLPGKPGVYYFRDRNGRVIYIGKAKNLSKRIRSYFLPSGRGGDPGHPISFFKDRIYSVDFTVTDNETEALILESSLIKKNRPKYNVFLKDDKSYPYIAVTDSEKFPRVFITRNRNIKGAKYFGPYINVKKIKESLELLRKIFQVRDCKKPAAGKIKNMVCLNYHIELCSAPCAGKIPEESYRKNIEYIKLFLKGRDKKIIGELKKEMQQYAKLEKFEEAQKIKDRLDAINALYSGQKIFFDMSGSWDVLSYAKDEKENMAAISVFNYKEGELASINNFIISNTKYISGPGIISGFIKMFYSGIDNISQRIFVPCEIEDMEAITSWFKEIKGKKIEFKVPHQGEKKEIIGMAAKNAALYLEKKKFEKSSGYSRVFKELTKLKDALSLKKIPRRIECFDISNLQATFTVGSMAVFIDGSPAAGNYRHFKIRHVEGQDDPAMMQEILARRLRYLRENEIGIEESFYSRPDLIVVDGGKAQYNSAKKILEQEKLDSIDLISLAKRKETVFCEKYPSGTAPGPSIDFMKILIRIRDEAHRFAINYHKKLRDSSMTLSVLDGIKGIGAKKKSIVLSKFGTLEELKACRLEDFLNIKGLSYKDALNIYNSLNKY